jgi:hypothetical protein
LDFFGRIWNLLRLWISLPKNLDFLHPAGGDALPLMKRTFFVNEGQVGKRVDVRFIAARASFSRYTN